MEFDIHVNERNPHYEYPSQPNVGLPILNGIYSRQNDFTLPAPNGFAMFNYDLTHTTTHIGFAGNTLLGNFTLNDEPLDNCCVNYIARANRNTTPPSKMNKTAESYLKLFPNHNTGNMLTLQYQFKKLDMLNLSLFNLEGRRLWYTPLFIPADAKAVNTTFNLQMLHLPPGMYVIRLSNKTETLTGKLVITK